MANLLPLRTNPFCRTYENMPHMPGMLADTKRSFGDEFSDSRYAVAPLHNRLGPDVVWFVWDADKLDRYGRAEVIRQEDSLEAAIAGLV